MAPSHDIFDTGPPDPPPNGSLFDNPGDTTAVDLGVSLPEYLLEVQNTLDAVERAHRAGEEERAVALALEGLAMLKINLPALENAEVPAYYEAFFRCHAIQPEYRAALALFKEASERRVRAVPSGVGLPEDEWRTKPLVLAWQRLAGCTAWLKEEMAAEALGVKFPVSGRLLQALARLKGRLQDALNLQR